MTRAPHLESDREPGASGVAPHRRASRLAAGATLAYTLVLVYATHHPRPHELVGDSPPSDKTLHLWAYTVLGLLAGATLALSGGWRHRRVAWLAAGLALFAALDEATQPLPWFGRFADPVDWLYDCLGIAVGLALVGLLVAIVARRARTRS